MEKRGKKGTFPSSAKILGLCSNNTLDPGSAKAPRPLVNQIWPGTVSFYKIHRAAEGVAGPQLILA